MDIKKFRLFSFITTLLLGTLLVNYANAEDSTKSRIQKHKEWLRRRNEEKMSMGFVEFSDPYQKIKYFKKLIKFKPTDNDEDAKRNEIAFVPHSSLNDVTRNEEVTTVIADTGSKFAYDTINKNEDSEVLVNKTSISRLQKSNKVGNVGEELEQSSPELNANTINENNEKQESDFRTIKNQMGGDLGDVVDTEKNKKPMENSMNSENDKNSVAKGTSNDFEIQKFIEKHIKYKSDNVTIKKSWGKWSPWSSCSRSCGEGVMSQSRECMEKTYKNGKRVNITTIALNECIGFYKRFRICAEMDCPKPDVDFRAQQCSEFNNHTFKGQKYEWEPYVKDDAECELHCRPVNQKYFARLREYAVDGTSCLKVQNPPKNSNSYEQSVCVEGKCKAVLKGGVISGSGFMNSGNVRCGNSVCRPISGVFAKNPLSNGYIHVTTIPAGASNITITELRNSINFLALKSKNSEYIINGNYTVSPSGSYEVAGTSIEYHRFDENLKETHHHRRSDGVTEWITSAGPLFEPIHLMVLSQQVNPGIKYEYLLPTSLASSEESASEVDYFSSGEENLPSNYKLKAANSQNNTTVPSTGRRKRKFSWKVVGFTPCSKSCSGGVQQPIIRCVRGEPMKAFSPKKCAHLKKPVVSESQMKCNSQPCPAFWKMGDWSSCRCGEFDEKANQSREVKCVQELISGVVIQVNSGACIDDRPLTVIPCECVKPVKVSRVEAHKQKPSIIQNTQSDQKPRIRTKPPKNRKSGSWLTSEWSEVCSSECGSGQQFRTVFCDRTPPNTERCDVRLTPNTYRECTSNVRCQGDWFIGPWSLCSGDCFNASKSRTVVCIKDDGFAEESECDLKSKPATFEDCMTEEMKDCKPKWHASEWSECNKNCGSGTQRRIIECLEPDAKEKILRKSSKCKYSERPAGLRHCNTHDCTEKTTTFDPRVDMIQNDANESCRDEFPNCNMVLKSKLCGYQYYNENCCQSCRMISNELY